ncbi:hypothetical protein D9M71_757830 [compost metagenome]
MAGLLHAERLLAAEAIEGALQYACTGRFGDRDGGVGRERIHHHDLVAERQRGQTIANPVGFVEGNDAGRKPGALGGCERWWVGHGAVWRG